MSKIISITAVDAHSSDSTTRSFGADNAEVLKKSVEAWETELIYRRYELVTQDFVSDYSEEVQDVLDELEVN